MSAGNPALDCHGVNESRQTLWRDLVQNYVNMFMVAKKARTGNTNFVGSFLKYDILKGQN
jgi:hypothetical protein